ncbi:hypothetical protein V2J09_019268 [Rumex salicifolius]
MKAAKARPLEEVAPSVPISSKRSLDDIDEQSDEDKTEFEVTKKKMTARKSQVNDKSHGGMPKQNLTLLNM